MDADYILWVLGWVGVNGVIGYMIGKSKNDVRDSTLISIFLGPIGWLIEQRPLMNVFTLYLAFHEPEIFKQHFPDSVQREPLFTVTKQLSKRQFFAEWLPDISGYSVTGTSRF